MPFAGPTWFLAWLLLFSGVYAVIDAAPLKLQALPRLAWMMVMGAALGAIQFLMVIACGSNMAFMPITIGSLPFDVWFFTAGVSV